MAFYTSFTLSEEAFLLSSLHEVVKVWSKGSGQANFNLQVKNGKADLQLNFHLGHPGDAHVPPSEPVQPHPRPHSSQEEGFSQPRRKSANRCKRDRERAARHQAGLRQLGSPAAKSCSTAETPQSVILPLSILEEHLVSLRSSKIEPRREPTATSASKATPSRSLPPPPLSTPKKLTSPPENFWSRSYIDVSATKKQLFADPAAVKRPPPTGVAGPPAPPASAPCPPAPRPRVSPAPQMSYQTREDQLWTRLFKKDKVS